MAYDDDDDDDSDFMTVASVLICEMTNWQLSEEDAVRSSLNSFKDIAFGTNW
jgi:hypothetical protein